ADRGARRAAHLVCRPRCRRHPDRRPVVERRRARRGDRRPHRGAVPVDPARDRRRRGRRRRRAELSDTRHDAGTFVAHETPEPGGRPADPACGGSQLSAAGPLARIAVGVVVERRRATSPWIDHVWRPVVVLAGVPETAPWTRLAGDANVATFYAGAAE